MAPETAAARLAAQRPGWRGHAWEGRMLRRLAELQADTGHPADAIATWRQAAGARCRSCRGGRHRLRAAPTPARTSGRDGQAGPAPARAAGLPSRLRLAAGRRSGCSGDRCGARGGRGRRRPGRDGVSPARRHARHRHGSAPASGGAGARASAGSSGGLRRRGPPGGSARRGPSRASFRRRAWPPHGEPARPWRAARPGRRWRRSGRLPRRKGRARAWRRWGARVAGGPWPRRPRQRWHLPVRRRPLPQPRRPQPGWASRGSSSASLPPLRRSRRGSHRRSGMGLRPRWSAWPRLRRRSRWTRTGCPPAIKGFVSDIGVRPADSCRHRARGRLPMRSEPQARAQPQQDDVGIVLGRQVAPCSVAGIGGGEVDVGVVDLDVGERAIQVEPGRRLPAGAERQPEAVAVRDPRACGSRPGPGSGRRRRRRAASARRSRGRWRPGPGTRRRATPPR